MGLTPPSTATSWPCWIRVRPSRSLPQPRWTTPKGFPFGLGCVHTTRLPPFLGRFRHFRPPHHLRIHPFKHPIYALGLHGYNTCSPAVAVWALHRSCRNYAAPHPPGARQLDALRATFVYHAPSLALARPDPTLHFTLFQPHGRHSEKGWRRPNNHQLQEAERHQLPRTISHPQRRRGPGLLGQRPHFFPFRPGLLLPPDHYRQGHHPTDGVLHP